ncbi:MAG: restriction endonuclease subunit S, partial [Bacteroides sp.]|nr:restriction endonuclease subunit S [Bacteroides sp.]
MTGKQLRNSILQWAIQGKLVPQDPNDEPASVLLERIRAEKTRLVKEKKIKKDKNESIIYRGEDNSYYEKFADATVRCIDDEIPFDIPDSWEWCRIRNISQSYIGLTYSPSDVNNEGVIVLRSSNIQNGKIDFSDLIRVSKEIPEKLKVEKNDIVICARNGSAKLVGKSAIIREIVEPMTFGAFMAICKTSLYEYVYTFLQSDIFFGQLRGVSSTTTINQLTQNNFNNFLIPIPPKEEQARICNNIAVVLPFIEQYGRKQEALSQLDKNVKEHLRKSLLQEAIQGRLLPQIEEEGTAAELLEEIRIEKGRLVKEGKLKKSALANESRIFRGEDNKYYENKNGNIMCIDDVIPFDLPPTWQWIRIGSILNIWSARRVHEKDWRSKGIPFYR